MKNKLPILNEFSVAIIGLGYVGLPLAIECAENIPLKNNNKVIGFDINKKRINDLKEYKDRTFEIDEERLKNQKNLLLTFDEKELLKADFFIITVPTPIDKNNKPDLRFIEEATITISKVIKKKKELEIGEFTPVVVYESTVFPGTTEEICCPIIEKIVNGKLNEDFFMGYSPERINPGDSKMRIENIVKVTSGSSVDSANFIDEFYSNIIKAGTFKAVNIKTAETSKVLENTQRDINIALINELAKICELLNIDTNDVLDAASTKWNFLNFKPGLVGGHCVGVDPYYFTYKSEMLGYKPEIVIAGRRINDGMAEYVTEKLILEMIKKDIEVKNADLLFLGLTFKENVPDFRHSQSIRIFKKLKTYGLNITVVDPLVDKIEVHSKFGIKVFDKIEKGKKYDVILLTVGHDYFKTLKKEWVNLIKVNSIIYDLKNIISRDLKPLRL